MNMTGNVAIRHPNKDTKHFTTSVAGGITRQGTYVCSPRLLAIAFVLMEMFRDVDVPTSWLAAKRVDT